MTYLLALDQGTSSSRSILFDRDGGLVAMSQRELTQHYPQPGWVEHDPDEIWTSQLATARDVLAKAGLQAGDLAAIGITNQRETTLIWHRRTGRPIAPAIVWQDRRTQPLCNQLKDTGWADEVKRATGLLIDPYFSGTKVRWLLDHVPDAQAAAEAGELAFGTVDSWLLWQLTGGAVHATDVTNAARTMLFDITRSDWHDGLLQALRIPRALMPAVHPSAHPFGDTQPQWLGSAVAVCGMAGDQQSAMVGQACFEDGQAKNTYGTGCFLLRHTGSRLQYSQHGLLSTRAAQRGPQPQHALEGSVFVGGAVVQWLRDGLRAIHHSADVEALAGSVDDAGGVVFVPAFTGLGAPYWQPDARGAILGLTRGSSVAHIARAALESIAFQSAALLQAMNADAADTRNAPVTELRVDGGASANSLLMQFQADILGLPVVRPRCLETTAAGAALLAGLGCGLYRSTDEIAALWVPGQRFEPCMPPAEAARRLAQWEQAVRQVTGS